MCLCDELYDIKYLNCKGNWRSEGKTRKLQYACREIQFKGHYKTYNNLY
jgi:hypothetical protein